MPTIGFNYSPGAGGGLEASWRIQLLQGGGVLADSGVQVNTANSLTPTLAPRLQSGTTYQHVITATSTDIPMTAGDSNQARATTSFTSTFAAPLPPISASVSVDANLMAVNVLATTLPLADQVIVTPAARASARAPAKNNARASGPVLGVGRRQNITRPGSVWLLGGVVAPTTLRVYHRRTGTTGWTLLAEAAIPTPGATQTIGPLMDQLAWGVSYDFAVSAVNAVGESALVTAGTAVLPQTAAALAAGMLHVAGNGQTYNVRLPLTGGPKITTKVDAQAAEVFGQATPVIRYGVLKYHAIEAKARVFDAATMTALQAVRDQALAGATLYWRLRWPRLHGRPPARLRLDAPSGFVTGNARGRPQAGRDREHLPAEHGGWHRNRAVPAAQRHSGAAGPERGGRVVQSLARSSVNGVGGPYTAAQVFTALTSKALAESWRFDRLAATGAYLTNLTPFIQRGSVPEVEHDTTRDVKRTLKLTVRGDAPLSVLGDLVRVHYQMAMPDGGLVDFSLSTFTLLPSEDDVWPGVTWKQLTGADPGQLLIDGSFLTS